MSIKAISLFSGAGGDTLGMINAGIDVVGYVENNKHANETHQLNFPNCKLIGTDIRKIKDKELKKYKNKVDIIFGGFPCQSFSHGGKKNPNDPRGFLYQEFVRFANIIKPKIIIGENVKGLLTRKDNEGKLFINRIVSDFEEAGYTMSYSLFNMKNYGIPQDRQRIILYGIRKDLNLKINLNNISTKDYKYNRDILEKSLEQSIEVSKKYLLNILDKKDICIKTNKDIEIVNDKPPPNLIKCYEKKELSYKKRQKPSFGCLIDKDDFSRTIICTYGRMPRLFVTVKNKGKYYIRPYTISELTQIQGFPKEFQFCGNNIQKIAQIGNAIPPKFITIVMEYIIGIFSGDIIEISFQM